MCKSSVKGNNQFKLSIYKFVRDPKQGTKFSLIEYCKSTKSNVSKYQPKISLFRIQDKKGYFCFIAT